MKLNGKVALITGASKGIGKEIVVSLANQGCKLVLCSRKTDLIKSYIPNLSVPAENILVLKCDVSNKEDVENTVNFAIEKFGQIDILVNNAGIWLTDEVVESKTEDFEQLMNVNYFGTYYFIHKVLPFMLQKGEGDIINISSTLGKIGKSSRSGYSASKFAVEGFTEGLREEVRNKNIRVVLINPGTTNTDLFGEQVDSDKSLSPVDIAEVVTMSLTLPRRALINQLIITPIAG